MAAVGGTDSFTVVASDDAYFGVPEVDRGALGAATHLARLVPQHLMRTLYFTGRTITAVDLVPHGSVLEVERYLKHVLSDPDSYVHVHTSHVAGEGDYWVVTSSFRSKDAFGATTFTTKKFFIQQESVVMVQ